MKDILNDIEYETLMNLSMVVLFWGLAIGSVIGVFFGAWWQLILGFFCYILGNTFYHDNEYGNESVHDWVHRIRSRK